MTHSTLTFDTLQATYLEQIELFMVKLLDSSISDERAVLNDAIRHSLLNGGKRIRPLLTIASSLLFSNDIERILPLACSLEIIHTYSLIHDDLPSMDNDDFRRGKPTCHVKYGEDIAILAGDTLNTLAFEVLATHLTSFDEGAILTIIRNIAHNMGISGLVGGQILDIKSSNKNTDLNTLNKLHLKKTGALIQLALTSPAYLYHADSNVINELNRFGAHLGLLFQIIDDILDVVGNKETLGKSPGKDHNLNKLTYPGIMSLDDCRSIAMQEKQKADLCLKNINSLLSCDTNALATILDFTFNRSH